jgi:inosine-uridine nucleoside N-ribohydrolase
MKMNLVSTGSEFPWSRLNVAQTKRSKRQEIIPIRSKEYSLDDKTISQRPTHIILDSDGSPDSVISLMYFLQHPAISVDALTVSYGLAYPDTYTAIFARILARLGRKAIPIAAGRTTPLVGSNSFPESLRKTVNEFMGIELPEVEQPAQPLSAAELIIKLLKESHVPMTLFVSGSHTNLAEALRLDPGIKSKIASVYVMGGALYVPGNIESEWPEIHNKFAEWNIWFDPVAASEVFSAGLPLHLTPLDATSEVVWTSDDADALEAFGTPEGKLTAELLRFYLTIMRELELYPDGVYIWDLVSAVNVTCPDFGEQEQLHIQIVTESGEEEGRTVVVQDQPANVTAFLNPNAAQIKQVAMRILGLPRDEQPVS